MAFGSSELYTALNVTGVTDLLDSFGAGKALFYDRLIPQGFTGDASINFYLTVSFDAARDIYEYRHTVNCRDKTHAESEAIASAVITAVNRVSYTAGYYITCTIVGTIPPADDTDNYNTIVEVLVKTRQNGG